MPEKVTKLSPSTTVHVAYVTASDRTGRLSCRKTGKSTNIAHASLAFIWGVPANTNCGLSQ